MNRRLFMAYLFKEQFEHAWTYTTVQACVTSGAVAHNWSRLTSLIDFHDMRMRHIDGVVG